MRGLFHLISSAGIRVSLIRFFQWGVEETTRLDA